MTQDEKEMRAIRRYIATLRQQFRLTGMQDMYLRDVGMLLRIIDKAEKVADQPSRRTTTAFARGGV